MISQHWIKWQMFTIILFLKRTNSYVQLRKKKKNRGEIRDHPLVKRTVSFRQWNAEIFRRIFKNQQRWDLSVPMAEKGIFPCPIVCSGGQSNRTAPLQVLGAVSAVEAEASALPPRSSPPAAADTDTAMPRTSALDHPALPPAKSSSDFA